MAVHAVIETIKVRVNAGILSFVDAKVNGAYIDCQYIIECLSIYFNEVQFFSFYSGFSFYLFIR